MKNKKGVWIAESGLYKIIEFEHLLLAAAEEYDVKLFEKEFDEMVNAAVVDWKEFNEAIKRASTSIKRELLVNFQELFEFSVDAKKGAEEEEGDDDDDDDHDGTPAKKNKANE